MATEKRLIDANVVIKETESIINFRRQHHMPTIEYEALLGYLKKLPTIDAVNRDGCKWCNGDYHTKIMATAIRYHSNGNMDGYEMKVNYCPHCGATMDGERKDNE